MDQIISLPVCPVKGKSPKLLARLEIYIQGVVEIRAIILIGLPAVKSRGNRCGIWKVSSSLSREYLPDFSEDENK